MSTPQEQAEPVAGEAFDGRYEVVAPISSGAMGAVYRALDREEGREVAVKRLLDVRHAARFEIEARLLASLSHPRLVKVLDHASDEQGAYIVMELVEGLDLGAMLKRDGDPGPDASATASSSPATAARPCSTCTTSRSSTATSSRRT